MHHAIESKLGQMTNLGGLIAVSSVSGCCSLRDLAGAWRSPGFLLRASSLTAWLPAAQQHLALVITLPQIWSLLLLQV